MLSLKQCQELITSRMQEIRLPEAPENLYDPIRYMLEPQGKKIRPSLVIMGCNLFSEEVEAALYPALAIEVFHNFTLMHDDIMDRALVRRGRPAVHVKWNQNIALLSGDAMLIKAYSLLAATPAGHLTQILHLFNQTARQVCEGQQYDMDFEHTLEIGSTDYIRMVELKTAVLIATALQIGAVVGGGNPEETSALYEFGKNMGIAFQLQDDLLDVYADPHLFGKSTGNDIVSNKKTVLLVQALELARGEIRRDLHYWLGEPAPRPEDKIKAVRSIYDALDLAERTKALIRKYYDLALDWLNRLPRQEERKAELRSFSGWLMNRNR